MNVMEERDLVIFDFKMRILFWNSPQISSFPNVFFQTLNVDTLQLMTELNKYHRTYYLLYVSLLKIYKRFRLNKDVVGAVPTVGAPTTSEWSTILLLTKVLLISEAWR